jgi:hypothetical protein
MEKIKFTTKTPMEMMNMFTQMMGYDGFENFFGGALNFNEREKHPYIQLGDGYELREIEILEEGGKLIVENRDKYSHLYHNGLKVSDKIFRKGGTGGRFKDGYISLIYYTQKAHHTKEKHGSDFGTHVIIDGLGDIKLKPTSSFSYPNHIGGHLGSVNDYIYDLRTGVAITPKPSNTIVGENCIIIEHRYSWCNKEVELPLGIYKIDFQTAEIVKIDDVK